MKSVKRLAHKYSCPQWIIDCRHSLCHSAHNQPSIEQLRSAAMIGLNWLKQFYWEKIISTNNNYNDNDFFELIHRYIDKNNIKIRKKIKKEIIFAIKHSRNEFILALIKHLVNQNSDSNDNEINYESLKIAKIVLRKFAPIFTIINSFNSLSILLYLIINEFDSQNRSIRHLALSWFSSIIKAIKSDNKVSKFQRSFASVTYSSVMPRIEWVRLLYRIAKHPNEHTSSLIVLIAPIVSDFISEEKIQIIINLSNLFCTYDGCENDDQPEDVVDNSDKEDNIKSVEDLIESVKGNNGISGKI